MAPEPQSPRHLGQGLIAWFARNGVAANLLMMAIVATGFVMARHIRQEIYPTYTLDAVEISMEYRGASPEEVEHSIILPIESELRGMDAVRQVTYEKRIHLLLANGALGLLLVILALGLFLELRVAFWTAVGIPVSILGSLFLLPAMDASINMISLFGFIITLGIVVDDAVVVGEEIFHRMSLGMNRLEASLQGVKAMTVPVVFAVSTNIIAFLPLLFERVDGARVDHVTANIIPGVTTGNKVLGSLEKHELPDILARYPGLRYSFEGEQREQRESMKAFAWGLVASLFVIYALVAALLRSYLQGFVVLLMIPWSLAGAVVSHVVMGFDLSLFSIFGMIALCGMVVNGAFVLAITRNEYVEKGKSPTEAVRLAAQRRFRPIFLTALTTFLGLAPMIFETSIQALFLVPMAISLGIGTLVSAVVVLTFIPAVMVVTEELGWETSTIAARTAYAAPEPG